MKITLWQESKEKCEMCNKEIKSLDAFVIMKEKTTRVCKECAIKHKEGD